MGQISHSGGIEGRGGCRNCPQVRTRLERLQILRQESMKEPTKREYEAFLTPGGGGVCVRNIDVRG